MPSPNATRFVKLARAQGVINITDLEPDALAYLYAHPFTLCEDCEGFGGFCIPTPIATHVFLCPTCGGTGEVPYTSTN
jgi:hypothetical protein